MSFIFSEKIIAAADADDDVNDDGDGNGDLVFVSVAACDRATAASHAASERKRYKRQLYGGGGAAEKTDRDRSAAPTSNCAPASARGPPACRVSSCLIRIKLR